jgi:Spy/CpxP family protein refolding chaperone
MKMNKWKAIAGVVLVFILGGLAGALGTMCICRHGDGLMWGRPHAYGEAVVRRLDHELKLSAEQKKQVEVIVNDARAEIKGLREQAQPKIDAIFEQAVSRVSAVLSPEQKAKFEKFVEKKRERMKRRQDE